MAPTIVRLQQAETIPERPFTDPGHSWGDLAVLRAMAEKLRYQLQQLDSLPWQQPQPLLTYLREPCGRKHRILIVDPGGLLANAEFPFVGFFGYRQPGAVRQMLDPVDDELSKELIQNPYFLSYSSLELEDGNWCNLVLLRSPEGMDHWNSNLRHSYAVRELAPKYYAGIRLHNGVAPHGLTAIDQLRLLRTKYYDYNGGVLWRAVRDFPSGLSGLISNCE